MGYDYDRRHVAGTAPSRAAVGFLTKAAKGIKGGLDPEALVEALPLIGWSIESVDVAVSIEGEAASSLMGEPFGDRTHRGPRFMGMTSDDKTLYVDDQAEAERLYAKAKSFEKPAVGKKGPATLSPGEVVLTNLTMERQSATFGARWRLAFDKAWLGVAGWRVKNPAGAEVIFAPRVTYTGRIEPLQEKGSERFWTFAYRSGLKEAAKDFLGRLGEQVVDTIMRPTSMRSLENTGTCPVCDVNVKLLNGRMIRHGWQVGGQRQRGVLYMSWHTGPCFGTGYEPWETSPVGKREFLAQQVRPMLQKSKEWLSLLQARPAQINIGTASKPTMLDPSDLRYEDELRTLIDRQKRSVAAIEATIKDMEHALATWEKRPLPGTPR